MTKKKAKRKEQEARRQLKRRRREEAYRSLRRGPGWAQPHQDEVGFIFPEQKMSEVIFEFARPILESVEETPEIFRRVIGMVHRRISSDLDCARVVESG